MNNLDITLRIVSVDMFGFQGREFHPTKEMEGKEVTVVEMRRVDLDSDEGFTTLQGDTQMFLCVSEELGTVELFDFEVELVKAEEYK